jgi:hypothetical protein
MKAAIRTISDRQVVIAICLLAFCLVLLSETAPLAAQSPASAFQQAVTQYQANPGNADLASKVIKLARAMNQLPACPEEAQKYFNRGNDALQAAKKELTRHDVEVDQSVAIHQFELAARACPWWPEARYNLAKAYEPAFNFTGAISSFKLWMLFKLSDDEMRIAQSEISSLQEKLRKDAEGLDKLRPLGSGEAAIYEKIKNDSAEVHKFVITRTYLRTIVPMIKDMDPDMKVYDGRKLPKMPEELEIRDVISDQEFDICWKVMLDQA